MESAAESPMRFCRKEFAKLSHIGFPDRRQDDYDAFSHQHSPAMTDLPTKSQYLLLFRNQAWYQELSPEEIQRVMTDWMAWFDGLVAEGRCLGGQSLEQDGRVIHGADRHITDGPYAESKEAVAGYFIVLVEDMDEALEIARKCPGLPYGSTVEVRQLMERCGASQMAESPELAKSL